MLIGSVPSKCGGDRFDKRSSFADRTEAEHFGLVDFAEARGVVDFGYINILRLHVGHGVRAFRGRVA